MKLIQAKTRFQRWLLLGLVVVSVLTVFIGLPAQAFAHTNKPSGIVCTQEYGYLPTLVNKNYLRQTGSPFALVNHSSSVTDLSGTVTVTGTTTYSLSGTVTVGVSAEAGVIFAKVKSEYSASVTGAISKTITQTKSITVTVKNIPPGATRHIAFGRGEIVTRGEYELILTNCSVVNEGTVTAYFPYEDEALATN